MSGKIRVSFSRPIKLNLDGAENLSEKADKNSYREGRLLEDVYSAEEKEKLA